MRVPTDNLRMQEILLRVIKMQLQQRRAADDALLKAREEAEVWHRTASALNAELAEALGAFRRMSRDNAREDLVAGRAAMRAKIRVLSGMLGLGDEQDDFRAMDAIVAAVAAMLARRPGAPRMTEARP